MLRPYIIGTRGSQLALWQAEFVKSHLSALFPALSLDIKIIKTVGDEILDIALAKIGDKGLFTKQIELELLNGEIDFAVHSLKDLQTSQPDGLVIGAVCKREVPNDALISKDGVPLGQLRHGAKVATGSLRRRSQLLNFRSDLEIVEIRGNVPTRLNKYRELDLDGLVLAYAGLNRLGLAGEITETIPFDVMLPAVGQGALAVEVRLDDPDILKIASSLDDRATRCCITAERAFLRRLEGGCQVPIGGLATIEDGSLTLDGMVGSLDGTTIFRDRTSASPDEAEALGVRLAEELIRRGAATLLSEVRETVAASDEAVI